MSFSFYLFFSFLVIFQVLRCAFLLFHVFQCFLPYSSLYRFVSHFPRFSVFLPHYWSYSVYFSYFTFFTVSRHIPGPTMCVSLFARFSVFLTIFHVLPCEFLFSSLSVFSPYSRCYSEQFSFFTFYSVSRHIPGHTVFVSHFPRISVFLPKIQVL